MINKNNLKRLQTWQKFGGCCAYCGDDVSLAKMQVDHVIPRKHFNKWVMQAKVPPFLIHLTAADMDHPDNLFPSCAFCNGLKKSKSLEDFRAVFGIVPDYLKKHPRMALAIKLNKIKFDETLVVFHFETTK